MQPFSAEYMGTLVGLLIRFVYLLQQSAKKLTDISRGNLSSVLQF